MKRFAMLACLGALLAPAAYAADVGVSINIAQPGLYGRIDIGNVPAPPSLIYARPMVIQPLPPGPPMAPLYLYVPPGYARHWRRHCHEYHACNRQVYFVQERWVNEVYVPHRDHGPDGRRFEGRGPEGHPGGYRGNPEGFREDRRVPPPRGGRDDHGPDRGYPRSDDRRRD